MQKLQKPLKAITVDWTKPFRVGKNMLNAKAVYKGKGIDGKHIVYLEGGRTEYVDDNGVNEDGRWRVWNEVVREKTRTWISEDRLVALERRIEALEAFAESVK